VVLVSGGGTNLQALIDACADPAYGASIVAAAVTASTSRCEAVRKTSANNSALEGKWR